MAKLALDPAGLVRVLPGLLDAAYHPEPHGGVHDTLAELFGLSRKATQPDQSRQATGPDLSPGLSGETDDDRSALALQQGVADMGPTVTWSLLRARAGLARRLGAAVVASFPAKAFSLRKIARIGTCDQKLARDWAVTALRARITEVAAQPQDIFVLLDGAWDDSRDAAYGLIRETGSESWPDAAVLALCDCVTPAAQGFGRELLARLMTPEAAPAFLMRLAEHPAPGFRLTIARLIRDNAGEDPARLRKLLPAMRRLLQRVHASRDAKEQIWRFVEDRIARGTGEARATLAPLLTDMAASVVRADRDRAIAALVLLRRHAPPRMESH